MNDTEILAKAIEKAGDNSERLLRIFDDKTFNLHGNDLRMDLVRGYIFSHDFAKALWGDKHEKYIGWKCEHCGLVSSFIPAWKHHLMQMVKADNPIKYLAENI